MKRIWSNGCYDIVHIGHIELFKYAKSLGDQLIVGIDSDRRVKELKGDNRPFNNQHNRKLFLESIRYIDQVVVFDSNQDLKQLIQLYNINTIVVGDDYRNKPVIGSEYAKVNFFSKLPNISTSKILEKITAL